MNERPRTARITTVEPLDDGYVLRLGFDDGVEGEVDLEADLWGPIFESLRDPQLFREVRVDTELGTIVWPNGADIDPDTLHGRVAAVAAHRGDALSLAHEAAALAADPGYRADAETVLAVMDELAGGRDPERGRAIAAELRGYGVKGILITAAEQGYITELACTMPTCFCPEELGGASYFEQVTGSSDWEPTHEHYPRAKREGGHRDLDNSILAHRLCNRLDYSIQVGRSHKRDLERIRKAREEGIRRNSERP